MSHLIYFVKKGGDYNPILTNVQLGARLGGFHGD
jgi:hypothetical protein